MILLTSEGRLTFFVQHGWRASLRKDSVHNRWLHQKFVQMPHPLQEKSFLSSKKCKKPLANKCILYRDDRCSLCEDDNKFILKPYYYRHVPSILYASTLLLMYCVEYANLLWSPVGYSVTKKSNERYSLTRAIGE